MKPLEKLNQKMCPDNTIRKNILRIQEKILEAQEKTGQNKLVTIVGVSKTHPPETASRAITAGLTHIGENRVQEAENKFIKIENANNVIKHMIGHLQSNKVKKAVNLFDRIDSVDSLKLAENISKNAQKLNKTIPVLLEINMSGEIQKHGFDKNETDNILACLEKENIKVEGLMTVGPHTKNEQKIRSAFSELKMILDKINSQRPTKHKKLNTLSMGMSGDYLVGVEEGSTMVRIGTAIFGARQPYF